MPSDAKQSTAAAATTSGPTAAAVSIQPVCATAAVSASGESAAVPAGLSTATACACRTTAQFHEGCAGLSHRRRGGCVSDVAKPDPGFCAGYAAISGTVG